MTVIRAWQAPPDLDPECLPLCEAINNCVGSVMTTESCCGHGDQPYRIWLHVSDLGGLPPLLYWLDQCHSGFSGWRMLVYTDCAASYPHMVIEGPVGAYEQADEIARHLEASHG